MMLDIPYGFSSGRCPTLYHYTSLDGARAILASNSLWVTDHVSMNDTSEFNYAEARLFALLRQGCAKLDPVMRMLVIGVVSGMHDAIGLFIGSLTARGDNLGQWRSYADTGRGCALEINADFLEFDAGTAIRTIVYDEQVADAVICAGLTVVQDRFEETPEDGETLLDYARWLAASLFAIKHPGFADEREVRISRMVVRDETGGYIATAGNRGDGVSTLALPVFARRSAFGDTHSLALPLRRDDGTSAIKGIALGPAMPPATVIEVTKEFEALGLTVRQSALPYRC